MNMKILLVSMLAVILTLFGGNEIFASENSYFDSVTFIQYLDEDTALEEVRNGNLDMYYFRISADRLENSKSREGLDVFDSTGGSYSILVNPAEGEKFNPFSIKEVRFALNYLVDRKLIVNELMAGYGAPMNSYYSPFDPEYLSIIEQLESFNFRYNPSLAEEIISQNLIDKGAKKVNNIWQIDGKPIEIVFFIRSDDNVRKSIGEILSSELEKIGFVVKKDFGDLNKAFVVVYGSDPGDLKWSLYTEGWGGRSAFVKYDSVGLGQMYSPWFSNMPGFNDPTYWNYQNDYIDSLTQRIYTGNFTSFEERQKIIQEAVVEGINESVRIFLASKIDQYVVNQRIDGVVNDFGAGVPSRFTPINSRGDKDTLVVGVKQIYQGAWNPVMGFNDVYSRHIWDIVSDPVTFKHPFNGETIPVRGNWIVETAGPNGKLDLPDDAIIWDPVEGSWVNVSPNAQAISKVTFDLEFSNWHNGQKMDLNDVLHSLYFTIEWGTQTDEEDKTFDAEFTPRAAQSVQTLIGVKPIDENTIEVYVDYWHFDEGEIADWAALWNTTPWEIFSAIENAVVDGKVSVSRSGAASKNVNWVSLIVPKDSMILKSYLDEFKEKKYIPPALKQLESNQDYFEKRYSASSEWIAQNNHAVISNGPFFLKSYSPESRTITVKAFDDQTYPFKAGHWSEFEKTEFPRITNLEIPSIIKKNEDLVINVETINSDSILYFLNDSYGNLASSESLKINGIPTQIKISSDVTNELGAGANDLKIFALSNSVLRPDYYSTSFLVSENSKSIPEISKNEIQPVENDTDIFLPIILFVAATIILVVLFKKKRTQSASP